LDTGEEWFVNLIREIMQDPSKYEEEAKLLLKIKTWHRQGGSFIDNAGYKVLWGEVEEVTISEWDEGYPNRCGEDIILIPKTVPTIVLYLQIEDYGERIEKTIVYVFTGKNWVSVQI